MARTSVLSKEPLASQPSDTADRAPTPRKRRRRRSRSAQAIELDHEHAVDEERPENLLARYFRDVAGLPVLQPEQEFSMAQRIEDLEGQLWTALLSHPGLAEPLMASLERTLGQKPPEFTQLRRAVRAFQGRRLASTQQRVERWAAAAASAVRPLDVDRDVLDSVVDELRRLARRDASHVFAGARVNVASRSFRKYYRRVRVLDRASQRARNEFVQANLRLVVTIARRFNYGHIPFHDLIQEGNIGLIKAVGRYDWRRGFRFSTYASWWIRHAITRAIADKGRLVRVPVHMLSTFQKVARTSRELSSKLGRPPTVEEICASTSLSSDKVEQIQEHLPNQAFSLDSAVSEDDDRRFIEMVQDTTELTPAERIGDAQVYKQVELIFGDLRPIEADVLRRRFGLLDGREHTLSEIGLRYSLSRERIRQIQEQALGKIRRALMRRNAM